jgi:uncharacterized protein YxjI
MMHPNFSRDRFLMHQKHLTIGSKYQIYDDQLGQPLFYVEKEKFKLRPAIHIYEDDKKLVELITIYQKNFLTLNPVYEVIEPSTHQRLGSFKRKGLRSLFRRQWLIYDSLGNQIGRAYEDSGIKALIRRVVPLGNLLKTDFIIEYRGKEIGRFVRKLTIRDRYLLDLTKDANREFDRRMAIALGILLDTAERR